MATFFTISRHELDWDHNVRAQLIALSEQSLELEQEYCFLPKEAYKDTFQWVLETNHIPYRLAQAAQ